LSRLPFLTHRCRPRSRVLEAGISGAKGREDRPGFDALLKAAAQRRKRFDVVMAWSVDRLGRSLIDLISGLQELHAAKVDLFLHQQDIDTTTPGGKALFQMMGVFADDAVSAVMRSHALGPERTAA
jgi:DNA invertase Pin-like site-specific DNA recombinase